MDNYHDSATCYVEVAAHRSCEAIQIIVKSAAVEWCGDQCDCDSFSFSYGDTFQHARYRIIL